VKREVKSEIVTVRLTPSERRRLDEIGGVAEVLRRALQPHRPEAPASTASARSFVVWQDGTVGQSWPALASA